MTRHISVSFGAIAGTRAGLGRAGAHSLVADRPEGKAGGSGLGFNGGELLASALAGCFWNDLHYESEARAIAVTVEAVTADLALAGTPARVVKASISARLSGAPQSGIETIFEAARDASTIANSLLPAFPISFELIRGDRT